MASNPESDTPLFRFLTHIPLFIIVVGCLGNLASFLIFRFNRAFKSSSTMIYLSFMAIVDTFSLFCWNLDHYLNWIQLTSIFTLNKPLCKLAYFDQYASLQSSALLLSIMSVDRYVQVAALPGSWLSRLPFRTPKSAVIWSVSIIAAVALINCHLLIFACFDLHIVSNLTNSSPIENLKAIKWTANDYVTGFSVFPTWQQIHTGIYIILPCSIVTVSNLLTTKSVMKIGAMGSQSNGSKRDKLNNTFLAIALNFLFFAMVLPANIAFSFDLTRNSIALMILGEIGFANHAILFFACVISHKTFRHQVFSSLKFFRRSFSTKVAHFTINSTARKTKRLPRGCVQAFFCCRAGRWQRSQFP